MSQARLNVLVAYPYLNAPMLEALQSCGPQLRFLLDSGAFTAWKTGKPIQLDDYCRFLDTLPIKPWRYFLLDVIGDPEATLRNYETMLRRGYTPVPIFTRGEDPSVLEDFYKTSDVVGIGGLVGTRGNKGFVRGIMKRIGARKVHWLGFANLDFLRVYRPYMCDSTAWANGERYGEIRLYMGRGRFKPVNRQHCAKKLDSAVLQRIRDLGVDPYSLASEQGWRGAHAPIRTLNARNGVALTVDVERHLGTRMFLAVSGPDAMKRVVRGFHDLYATRQKEAA